MPVPNNITELDTTASMNSPQGGESPKGTVDNYLRAAFAFIRQLYNTVVANAATAAAAAAAAQATANSKQAALGFTPVQQGTGIGQLPNTVKIGWSGSRIKATIDATDMGGLVTDSVLSGASVNYAASAGTAGSVGGVSSPATAGALVQYQSDTTEFGSRVNIGANVTADLPAPYVLTGLRTQSVGGGWDIYLRGRALKNQ